MAYNSTHTAAHAGTDEPWPHKLNKALIAIGIIAFGLIVTDRVLHMFSDERSPAGNATSVADPADSAKLVEAQVPETVDIVKAVELPETAEIQEITEVAKVAKTEAAAAVGIKASATDSQAVAVENSSQIASPAPLANDDDVLVELRDLFGSRVVFVSASEPAYVMTEDDRRFEIGSPIDEGASLAGVTADQLIIERQGDLTIMSLPDPVIH